MAAKNAVLPAAVLAALCAGAGEQAQAVTLTLATNGNVGTAADWDGTLGGPGAFPDSSNPGFISAAAVTTAADLSAATGFGGIDITTSGGAVTITQGVGSNVVCGNGSGEDFGIYVTSGTLAYTVNAGTLQGRLIRPGNNTTLTLSGGAIIGVGRSNESIFPQGNGQFVMTGGTVSGLGLQVGTGGSATLTGGTWADMGANNAFNGMFVNNGGTVTIGNTFELLFATNGNNVTPDNLFSGTGVYNISTGWIGTMAPSTGTWTFGDEWTTALTSHANVYLGGTLLTTDNLATYAAIDTNGALTFNMGNDYSRGGVVPNNRTALRLISSGLGPDTPMAPITLGTAGITDASSLTNAYTVPTSGTDPAITLDIGSGKTLRLAAAGSVASNAGMALVISGGTLTAGGATAHNPGTLSFDSTSGITVSSAIADNGNGAVGITNTAGTLTLAAGTANTYSGATTVDAGTLIVNGTHTANASSDAYSVNNAATLAGAGTINIGNGSGRTVTIASTAFITAGADAESGTVGTLDIIAQSLNLTGTYQCDVNLNVGLAGIHADDGIGDLINLTGALDTSSLSSNTFMIRNNVNAPAAGTNYAIKILSFSSVTGLGDVADGQQVVGYNGTNGLLQHQSIVRWGNAYYLVPEPASFALLGLGSLLLLRRPSRRRGCKVDAMSTCK